ncbi:TPM domain-containing protein [Anabaena sp. FACHB-1237]|uniref:photosystem II repair protein Psb32 n=1 Tax=Anabaena sp. FACHB-1237 TaxID=2692769 RepID=UPI00168175D9|nr:TPM domain-containing protein [Anabaena sp. FACHB-1237]MBD2139100.1 TPM domain-containing protein [Anabaena sp. FACHB-1237]
MLQILKQLFSYQSYQKYFTRLILPVLVMVLSTAVFILPAHATGVYEIPSLSPDTWILDQGEVVSRANEGEINGVLRTLSKKTGNNVRIVTIRRFDYGETPLSFAQGLFTQWFTDQEQQNHETLLLIDTLTNGAAIVSGNAVKPLLTDAIANSVVNETLGVALRDGNKYNQAFLDVSDRLSAVLSGEADPGPPKVVDNVQVEGTFTKAEDTDQGNATAWVIGLLIAATVIPMATYYIYQINQPSSGQ